MKYLPLAAIAFLIPAPAAFAQATVPAPAAASTPAQRGDMLYTIDNYRIGRIGQIHETAARVIYGGRFVEVPLNTVSKGAKGLTTSLTRAEIGRL